MKTILDLYSESPYGWLQDDIRLLSDYLNQEIKMQLGGDYLNTSDKNLIQYMTKKDYTDRLLIKKEQRPPENI